jgi:hypothetical protein
MPQDQKFEIPQELRQLAEENVERARQLYLQFMDGVGQAMASWSSASSEVIAPGFREVQERAVNLANENADAAFKLAKDVAQAKDLHELIDLQTRYVQSQMKWYADQSQEFGRLMAKALTDLRKGQNR